MSREYDLYLKNHRDNVTKGFQWMVENLPDVIAKANEQEYEIPVDLEHQIVFSHDASKNKPDEYEAYDAYFYGGNRSYQVLKSIGEHGWFTFIGIHTIGSIGFLLTMIQTKARLLLICLMSISSK